MKRILAFLSLCTLAHAVGTVQQTTQQVGNTSIYTISLYWTGDAITGTVPVTLVQAQAIPIVQGYRVITVETVPGSPAPTNNYSVALLDTAGVDVLAGAAANDVSSSNAQSFAGSPTSPPIFGSLSLSITGQSVGGAKGTIFVYLAPFSQVIGLSPTAPSFPAQGADLIYASPCNATGSPGFRALCAQDLTLAGLLAGANTWTSTNAFNGATTFTANSTFSGATVDLHGSTKTLPNRSGTGSPNGRDNCATVGESYFQTDGTAGQNIWGCTTVGSPGTWTLEAGSTLPAGTQTQFLRIQPNTGNNTTLQFSTPGYISSPDYNFPAYSCNASLICAAGGSTGGTISPGPTTITMNPCPLGVNGTDANHPIYITGGSGAAEAPLITSGTCTSGASTGNIVFTAANSHSGAFTIASATSGIQEAIVNASVNNVAVYIPGGFWPIHGTITALTCPTIFGDGFGNNSRANLVLDNAINGIVYGGSSNVAQCNAAIFNISTVTGGGGFSTANVAVTFQHIIGGLINNISVTGGFEGIRYLDVRGATLVSNVYAQADSIGQHITCNGVALPNCANEMGITNMNIVMGTSASAGLQIEPTTTGVTIENLQVACGNNSLYGLLMVMNATGPLNEIQITNGFLDGCTSRAIYVQKNTGAVANNALQISNMKMSSSTSSNNPVVELQAPLTNMMFYGNTLLQTNTSGSNNQGMEVEGVTNSVIANNTIGVSQNTSYPILFGAGPASEANVGLLFVGNQLGLIGTAPNHSIGNTSGDTTDTNLRFSANTFTGDIVAFPVGTSNIIVDSSNQNIAIPVVASAATLPIPVNPIFTVSGNTNSTAVSNCPTGKVGKFVTTAAAITFTAGATIGNTFTTVQNVPVDFYCDGAKFWLH